MPVVVIREKFVYAHTQQLSCCYSSEFQEKCVSFVPLVSQSHSMTHLNLTINILINIKKKKDISLIQSYFTSSEPQPEPKNSPPQILRPVLCSVWRNQHSSRGYEQRSATVFEDALQI